MSCERCGGLMVIDSVGDDLGKDSRPGMNAERCINCGNFEDSLIQSNRGPLRLPRRFGHHTIGQGTEVCSAKLVAVNRRRPL